MVIFKASAICCWVSPFSPRSRAINFPILIQSKKSLRSRSVKTNFGPRLFCFHFNRPPKAKQSTLRRPDGIEGSFAKILPAAKMQEKEGAAARRSSPVPAAASAAGPDHLPSFSFPLHHSRKQVQSKGQRPKTYQRQTTRQNTVLFGKSVFSGYICDDSLHMMWQDGFPRCGSRIRREGLD